MVAAIDGRELSLSRQMSRRKRRRRRRSMEFYELSLERKECSVFVLSSVGSCFLFSPRGRALTNEEDAFAWKCGRWKGNSSGGGDAEHLAIDAPRTSTTFFSKRRPRPSPLPPSPRAHSPSQKKTPRRASSSPSTTTATSPTTSPSSPSSPTRGPRRGRRGASSPRWPGSRPRAGAQSAPRRGRTPPSRTAAAAAAATPAAPPCPASPRRRTPWWPSRGAPAR